MNMAGLAEWRARNLLSGLHLLPSTAFLSFLIPTWLFAARALPLHSPLNDSSAPHCLKRRMADCTKKGDWSGHFCHLSSWWCGNDDDDDDDVVFLQMFIVWIYLDAIYLLFFLPFLSFIDQGRRRAALVCWSFARTARTIFVHPHLQISSYSAFAFT